MKHCLGWGRSHQFISPNKYVSGWVRLHIILLESIGWAKIWDTLLLSFIQKILGHFITSDVAQTCMEFCGRVPEHFFLK